MPKSRTAAPRRGLRRAERGRDRRSGQLNVGRRSLARILRVSQQVGLLASGPDLVFQPGGPSLAPGSAWGGVHSLEVRLGLPDPSLQMGPERFRIAVGTGLWAGAKRCRGLASPLGSRG